ncbi:MAG: PUA domain-containing protein [Nitrososphaerota archaeon]|nr:PUA domain-containing protein [Nitrososphaerota archaeon]
MRPEDMYSLQDDFLRKIRCIADYQFGLGAGNIIFPDNVEIIRSKRTGKIRHVYHEGRLLATLRPSDGLFSLSIEGAKRLFEGMNPKRLWVKISSEASIFVGKGSDVFAKHVLDADEEIRPGEEVIILDNENKVIAVGRSVLTGDEMKKFNRGVAVKIRKSKSPKKEK